MWFGRLRDPAVMGRLSSLEEVGPSTFEKVAGLDAKSVGEGLLGVIQFAQQHPAVTGTVAGGVFGALRSSAPDQTERQRHDDPHAGLRHRIGGMLGGAAGGALVGNFLGRNAGHPMAIPMAFQQLHTTGRGALNAGRSVANVFAPGPSIPDSLTGLLGEKKRYTEKDVQNKYHETFGHLDAEKEAPDAEHEARFISALRDIYHESEQHTTKAQTAPSKMEIVKQKSLALGAAIGMAAVPALMGFNTKATALSLLPTAVQHAAGLAKSLKQQHVDPGVSVDSHDAQSRAKFDDNQLRQLLRGLGVEEVKEHVIK